MSWFSTGYEASKKAYADTPKDGGGQDRFWLRPEETQRVMFLEDDPTAFWEHGYPVNGKWGGHTVPCLKKNAGLGSECPACTNLTKNYPYFIGLHSVITLTPFVTEKGAEYCYQRRIFGARFGSNDKPGILRKLERLKAKAGGRLRGVVIEAYRSGKKTESVGDELSIIEDASVDPDKIQEFAMKQLEPFIERRNKRAKADKQVTVEKYLEWNPWEPYNFEEVIKVVDYKQMLAMFPPGGDGGASGGGSHKREEDDDGQDDDIPY
jgi:hypothetical protein